MAMSSPVGTSYYLSSTFASAKTITAVTNANPAVATSTSHGYSTNDELLFTSGWELASNSVFKGTMADANSFSFQGLNTTNTNNFAAGSGTGTTQKISSWVEIPQVLSINPNGGRPRFIDVRTIKALQGIKLPDGFDAMSIDFEIAWDISQTNWSTLVSISRDSTLVAYKSVKGSGAATYAYGYFMMGEAPLQQSGQVDRAAATFVALGRTISY